MTHAMSIVSKAEEPISCEQWNSGYGADSGPSRSDPCRRALRPIEASKATVCYVRNTSIPAGRNASEAAGRGDFGTPTTGGQRTLLPLFVP